MNDLFYFQPQSKIANCVFSDYATGSRTSREVRKSAEIIILIFATLFSFQVRSQNRDRDSIQIESKIRLFSFQKVEYAVLNISYKNCGKDTVYLWTQNWRIHYLQ